MIPAEAVEAAAKALWEPNEHGDEWVGEFDSYKDYLRDYAMKALEAAAPHMLAEALELATEIESDGSVRGYVIATRIRQAACGHEGSGHLGDEEMIRAGAERDALIAYGTVGTIHGTSK